MRIEWLNSDMTSACLTKGWPRRRYAIARLTQHVHGGGPVWVFMPSGNEVPLRLQRRLDEQRASDEMRHRERSDWRPVEAMAVARVVRR